MPGVEKFSITASGALLFIVSVYIFRDLSSFIAAQGVSGSSGILLSLFVG